MIRIEIGAMPPLLRSIVSSALETEVDLVVTANDGRADVLVVCSGRGPDDGVPVGRLLEADPPAIVAIDPEGTSATILRITAESRPIGAAADLCEAIRRADRPRMTN